MQFLRRSCLCIVLGLTLPLLAQQPPSASAVDNDFVQKQFGSTCTLMPGPPQLKADMDGDGIEDLVVAARCTNALVDPATRGLVLLVIHGAGPEAWRAATPKAKFVIINLPFKQVAVKKLTVKKKNVMAIYAEETGGDHMTSATFWDGKKYRYQPIGSSME